MDPVVIGLMGAKKAGKDTTCDLITGWIHLNHGQVVQRLAFADKVKEFAYALDPVVSLQRVLPHGHSMRLSKLVDEIGFDAAKEYPDVRRLLQRLGTEAGRNLDEDLWVKQVYPQISDATHADPPRSVVITDVRFQNEIDLVKLRPLRGCLCRIDRPQVEDGDPHPSERAWRGAQPDYVIDNSGDLEQLTREVDWMMSRIVGP